MALQPNKIEGFPNACKDVRTSCRLCLVQFYFQDKKKEKGQECGQERKRANNVVTNYNMGLTLEWIVPLPRIVGWPFHM